MPASTSIKQRTGPSGSSTDTTITNQRMCLADAVNDGSAHPVAAANTGTVYSFVQSTALWADTAPTTGINNVRYYTAGTNPWTGVTLQVASSATYTQATGTTTTGTQLTTTNFTGSTSPVDGFSLTSAAPLAIGGSVAAVAGKVSNFVEAQVTVASNASQGQLAATTAYWLYDES